MIPNHAGIVPRIKTWRNGNLQIPQDLKERQHLQMIALPTKRSAKIFGQYDHVRIYGRDYFDKLRSIGFTVVEEDYTNKIAPELVENTVWPR
jgi:hypothetical protein